VRLQCISVVTMIGSSDRGNVVTGW
jgi:hypothetical protein